MISQAFSRSELPNQTQNILLCLLGVFLPPLPIFILSGPKYTVKTKEFLISCVLSLTFYFYLFAIIYVIHFILVTFPRARLAPNGAGYYGARDLENRPANFTAPESIPAQAPGASGVEEDIHEDHDALLPAYQEVDGARNNTKASRGDNKVQH